MYDDRALTSGEADPIPMISGTILIKASQEMLGIIKHSTTLFQGRMVSKREVIEGH